MLSEQLRKLYEQGYRDKSPEKITAITRIASIVTINSRPRGYTLSELFSLGDELGVERHLSLPSLTHTLLEAGLIPPSLLIHNLAMYVPNFPSPEDLAIIRNLFSSKSKQSLFSHSIGDEVSGWDFIWKINGTGKKIRLPTLNRIRNNLGATTISQAIAVVWVADKLGVDLTRIHIDLTDQKLLKDLTILDSNAGFTRPPETTMVDNMSSPDQLVPNVQTPEDRGKELIDIFLQRLASMRRHRRPRNYEEPTPTSSPKSDIPPDGTRVSEAFMEDDKLLRRIGPFSLSQETRELIQRYPLLSPEQESVILSLLRENKSASDLKRYISSIIKNIAMTDGEKFNNAFLDATSGSSNPILQFLVLCNLRLVRHEVLKYNYIASPDDLFPVGVIGLQNAIIHFNSTLGNKLSTYAVIAIRHAIRRTLAEEANIPEYLYDLWLKTRSLIQQFNNELGRLPTDSELSEILQVSPNSLENLLAALKSAVKVSLDTPLNEIPDASLAEFIPADRGINDDDDRKENDEIIMELLSLLPERLRQIIELRLGIGGKEGLALEAIAKRMGISRQRVSQLEQRAYKILLQEFAKLTGDNK